MTVFCGNGKVTIHICDDTVIGTFYHDSNANEDFSLVIYYMPSIFGENLFNDDWMDFHFLMLTLRARDRADRHHLQHLRQSGQRKRCHGRFYGDEVI